MTMKTPTAILFHGGWAGHEPDQCADLFSQGLRARGFAVDTFDHLDILDQADRLAAADLIVPIWTMGTITKAQLENLSAAVRSGVGLGGFHGGMGDAFRGATDYEWLVGGHFVGHPHVGPYSVQVVQPEHPVVAGLEPAFDYDSEQYYLLTDPGNDVLATTEYTHDGQTCAMPVVWTKRWGQGRVFYSALGHKIGEFDQHPKVFEMTLAGLEWATRRG
jgi:type 1 glutamine amidotransferase